MNSSFPRPIHAFIAPFCFLLASGWAQVVRAQVDTRALEAERARVAVVERASRAAVSIFTPNGQGGGSGVLISPDGYALSNFHVTHSVGPAMKCGLSDGNLYDAVIVGIDPTGDIALVKLLGREDFPYAEMADSDQVAVGDWCFTIGNPFLLATDFQPSVAFGIISGVHRYQYPAGTILEYTDCLQADAAINPGNSGGPMFDAKGRLIGINGRGSFEKRGRVNVGVGYAISINQVRNFLGHLKSGRIVDHATLGATLRTDDGGKVRVDEILPDSDLIRRNMTYGDEVIAFGGRSIKTVNAFKNVLGIFPKGWRVPITFRHRGETIETFVRLRGAHRQMELEELVAGAPKDDPNKAPQPTPDPRDGRRQRQQREAPRIPIEAAPPAEIPAAVKPFFEEKPGYVNYYFNRLHRDRVWNALPAGSSYAALTGKWVLRSEPGRGDDVRFEIADNEAAIRLPSGELRLPLEGNLSTRLEPRGSGGLLVALAMWRRFLLTGPDGFGDVTYWGSCPWEGHESLVDVLEGHYRDITCRFLFDPREGQLVGVEFFPDEYSDPCELHFSDFRTISGVQLPARIDVRYGDLLYQVTMNKRFRYDFIAEEAP